MCVQLRRYFPNPLVFRSHNFSKYSVHYNNDEGHDVQLLSLGDISTSVGTQDFGSLIGLSPVCYKLEVRGPSSTETSKENQKEGVCVLKLFNGMPTGYVKHSNWESNIFRRKSYLLVRIGFDAAPSP